MTDLQILEGYRAAVLEMAAIREQISLYGLSGKPCGTNSIRLDGDGCRTNDKTAAIMQILDGLEDALHERMRTLEAFMARFERIIATVRDPMTAVVLRRYYGMGETDAQVGVAMGYSERRVNQLRRGVLTELQ